MVLVIPGVQESIKNCKEAAPENKMQNQRRHTMGGSILGPTSVEISLILSWMLSGSILVPRSFQDLIWIQNDEKMDPQRPQGPQNDRTNVENWDGILTSWCLLLKRFGSFRHGWFLRVG